MRGVGRGGVAKKLPGGGEHHVQEMIILAQADNFILGYVVPVQGRHLMR